MFSRKIILALATFVFATNVWSLDLDKQVNFNIPAQALASALVEFSKQAKLQVITAGEETKSLKSVGITGKLSLSAALNRLLRNSGLSFKPIGDSAISIGRFEDKAQKSAASVNETGSLVLAQGKTPSGSSDGVEEMLVEGEREKPVPFSTANLDLTRTEDDVLPFTVFTARDIELSGSASLQEFLQNRLPQNFNADIPEELNGAGDSDVSRVDRVNLRGWGATETVFLLNGRRLGPQFQGFQSETSNATPNLQGIPLGSIERIEILTAAGSAIYGTSATGGVINIITRRDFSGGQVSIGYETPADVDAPKRSMNLNYGLPFKWGTSLRLSAGYSDYQPMKAGDRAALTIERWRQLVVEREPTRLLSRTASPPVGATPNIRTATTTASDNLFGPGTANFTTSPDRYAGNGGLSVFQPGIYNLQLSEGSAGNSLYGKASALGALTSNATFGLGMDASLGSRWRWSVDYRYSQNDSEGRISEQLSFQVQVPLSQRPMVPGSAPINPFGKNVLVALIDPRILRPELENTQINTVYELSSTLRGKFGEWQGFADLIYSHNNSRFVIQEFTEPAGGWTNAFMNGAYNPFVDTRTVAPAAASFYENYTARRTHLISATLNYQAMAKISGPAFRLPAGAVQLTAGADWTRSDRHEGYRLLRYQNGATGAPQPPVESTSDNSDLLPPSFLFASDTYSGYAEVNVPLLTATQEMALVQELELFGSGRLSHQVRSGFQSDGRPIDYITRPYVHAFGLRYEPLEGVSLRISQSIGFKPPTIQQVTPSNPPTPGSTTSIADPRRAESRVLTHTQFISGGNPDVDPETTDSKDLGMVLMPRSLPGLRLSVDYIESVRDDAITSIAAQLVVDLEADFPERVQRSAPDGHASGVGPITFLDYRNINFRQIVSKNLDFSLEQQFENVFNGRLTLTAAATKNLSFKLQTTNTTPPVEQVRNIGATSSQHIEWNANGQLLWEGRQWSFGWNARYFDYILVRTADLLLQGSDRAPWKLNHDINMSYRPSSPQDSRGIRWFLSGSSITFGVKNLFDREPRFWALASDRGVAPYDSIMGRSVWVQMRKDFH